MVVAMVDGWMIALHTDAILWSDLLGLQRTHPSVVQLGAEGL